MIVIIAGTALGLALLAILAGVLYDRVWIPSRPIARVGSQTLSRGGYVVERRHELARNIVSNLQLLSLFSGQQLGAQFAGQTPAADSQVKTIQSTSADEPTVSGWIERQVIISGANGLGIQASDGEIAQMLTKDLGSAFPPPPPAVTGTTSLSPTATLSETAALTGTATASAATETATANGTTGATATASATATITATQTPQPTPTPEPTLLPDAALQEQEQVIKRIYDRYVQEIFNTDPQRKPNLSIDDFKSALHDQYLREVLAAKIQEHLVPEASFQPGTDPTSLQTRHILIKVTVPMTATAAAREAAFAKRRPEAEAILRELRNGADFATIAKQRSEDASTRDQGGELPSFDSTGKTISDTQIDPAFLKATLALKENEISDLVQTPFGWHIIQLTQRTVPSKEEQLRKARTEAFDKWISEQRAAVQVERFPPQTPTSTPAPTAVTPLPTAPLGGEPTPVTNTTTLTNTALLTDTALPVTSTPTPTTAASPSPVPTGTP